MKTRLTLVVLSAALLISCAVPVQNTGFYKLRFDPNGGVGSMTPQVFSRGETKALNLNTFTRPGFSFSGWSGTATGDVAYTDGAAFTMLEGNATLFAIWSANTYSVTFDANGGTGSMPPQFFLTGETRELDPNSFLRTGFTFIGWSPTMEPGPIIFDGASYMMGPGDLTLYARWMPSVAFISVPGGRFQRDADSENISSVSPFRLSMREITREQFLAVMGIDPVVAGGVSGNSGGVTDPVMFVNWYQAIAFCNRLSLAEGLQPVYAVPGVDFSVLEFADIPTTDNSTWNSVVAAWNNDGYRLPTEMEWMWAAMGAPMDGRGGGTNTTGYLKAFSGSTGANAIGDFAVFGYTSGEDGATADARTNPVGTRSPNELGLYDMSGNVWEFCWDWYGSYPYGTVMDYRGPASGTSRIMRGGSWYNAAYAATIMARSLPSPSGRDSGIGLRLAVR